MEVKEKRLSFYHNLFVRVCCNNIRCLFILFLLRNAYLRYESYVETDLYPLLTLDTISEFGNLSISKIKSQ